MKGIIRIVMIKLLNMVVDMIIGVFLSLALTIVTSLTMIILEVNNEPTVAFLFFTMTWRRVFLSWVAVTALYHTGAGFGLMFTCHYIAKYFRSLSGTPRQRFNNVVNRIPVTLFQDTRGWGGYDPDSMVRDKAKPLAMPLIQRLYRGYQRIRRREV